MERDINRIIHTILENGKSDLYFRFSNPEGKFWLIPSKQYRKGLALYQPTSRKGKILHRFFYLLSNFSALRKIAGIKKIKHSINPEFRKFITNSFGLEDVQISLFSGTPSTDQKIIIQIFNSKKIYGFCKITQSSEIAESFYRESRLLIHLSDLGMSRIPKSVFSGEWNENLSVFMQTTEKTEKSYTIHKFNDAHWNFLNDLHNKTSVLTEYLKSDFYNSISYLLSVTNRFSNDQMEIIMKTIEEVNSYYVNHNKIRFSAYHGDFTPWNCYFEKGSLYVFDFEYTKLSYPPLLDWFHFFTQVGIFKNEATPSYLLKAYKKERRELLKHFVNPEMMYKSYLLDIISFYQKREKGTLKGVVKDNMNTWVELLKLL